LGFGAVIWDAVLIAGAIIVLCMRVDPQVVQLTMPALISLSKAAPD
jgi:hypothetical protein